MRVVEGDLVVAEASFLAARAAQISLAGWISSSYTCRGERVGELLRMAPSALRSASPQVPASERRRIDNISAKNFDYGTSAP
jgi:hypothetical protein